MPSLPTPLPPKLLKQLKLLKLRKRLLTLNNPLQTSPSYGR
jgi:hypothetical protein